MGRLDVPEIGVGDAAGDGVGGGEKGEETVRRCLHFHLLCVVSRNSVGCN